MPIVVVTKGATLNDIVVFIRCLQGVPKSVHVDILVLVRRRPGGAVECLDSSCWVAANDVFVVAMVLGKGFLEDGTIDRFIPTWLGVQSMVFIIPFLKWEIVIDNDCVRDTKGVELDGVDTVVAYIVVQEDLLEAASFFGKGRSSGNEPAVAD